MGPDGVHLSLKGIVELGRSILEVRGLGRQQVDPIPQASRGN